MEKFLSLDEIIEIVTDDDTDYTERSTYPRLSKRNDLHVMMLLSQLIDDDNDSDIISYTKHDIIYFNATPEQLDGKVTLNQLLSMMDCGLFYDNDCFTMYV